MAVGTLMIPIEVSPHHVRRNTEVGGPVFKHCSLVSSYITYVIMVDLEMIPSLSVSVWETRWMVTF